MDGWKEKRKWKTRKAGGLTGRHTLVIEHKSSEDQFFTFPECDARERNSRPARLPAGNRNHVRRQKTAALWYTSLFGNVSSLGSPVIISKYGTHFYFNLRRIIRTSPINPFDLSFLLLVLIIYESHIFSFPFLFLSARIFVKFFRRKMQNTLDTPLIAKRKDRVRLELPIFVKMEILNILYIFLMAKRKDRILVASNFRKNGNFKHFEYSPNDEEKRSNFRRFEFSIFKNRNFKHSPNREEERSNSDRLEFPIFTKWKF